MNVKKRKRDYKRNYKKNYKTSVATIKRAPKTEVKYFNYEINKIMDSNTKSGDDITGLIDHGTGRHERIGDKITVVGVRVRLRYIYASDVANSPVAQVRHFLFWSRVELNNVGAGGTWFLDNDDVGTGMDIVDRPVNKQVAIPLKDKVFSCGNFKFFVAQTDNGYISFAPTEKNIGRVDYFLKLNRDVYFSGVSKPNPQLILADGQTSGGEVNCKGLITLYYIDY